MNDEKPPCDGLTDLFFDERIDTPEGTDIEAEAKSICATCPLRVNCLAVGMNEKEGIWGMTTARDRRKIKRRDKNPGKNI